MELYTLYNRYPRITTDSRRVERDSIFFALHGENFNGNQYAAAALTAGAAIAVIDDIQFFHSLSSDQQQHYVWVPDTLTALQELAAHHRKTLGIPLLAITGSNGKTTSKELINKILSKKYHTAVTYGNFNNHIGVPLTLLSMDSTVEFGVVEMGANHCGEIARLCEIAFPDFGLITNIGKAHLEGFGGIEGVKRGKGELLDHLATHSGTVFYLQESTALTEMISQREPLRAIPYTTSGLSLRKETTLVTVQWGGRTIHTHLVGSYNLDNIAGAIAVGLYFGVREEDIVSAIESFLPDNNRSQRLQTAHNTLICDAYNANPSSMRAAIENFAHEPSPLPKTAILGDMRELGPYAEDEHRQIVSLLQSQRFDEVYLVGPEFSQAGRGIYPVFPNTDSFKTYLESNPLQGRLILLKGSHGMQLECLMKNL